MDSSLLGRAVLLGFTIAAAVGPISVLTIRRTLAHGPLYGLASGLGVALADATYAAVAAFGLTAVTSVLVGSRAPLGVVGGLLVVWIGVRTFRSRPTLSPSARSERPSFVAAFASIYALTMTNPMTILSFVALFAALGLAGTGGAAAVTVTAGVFLGSAAWWVVLAAVVALVRTRVTPRALRWVNRASGLLLVAFGATAAVATVVAAVA